MILFKKTLAERLELAVKEAFPDATLTADELFGMLEYPPDDTKGDVALPCFKLSKSFRSAPPKIAAASPRLSAKRPVLLRFRLTADISISRLRPVI